MDILMDGSPFSLKKKKKNMNENGYLSQELKWMCNLNNNNDYQPKVQPVFFRVELRVNLKLLYVCKHVLEYKTPLANIFPI